ncbi:S-Ena type endospore appendage [Brevibacillus laterosporus]|uniref:S-Ena type endospore appendage n=1 Tax=Brevibacillus laterosporus TaxID=1465 RepID=UPI003D197417
MACSSSADGGCCPPAQMFQEQICGNFNGPLAGVEVWSAPAGAYFSGTFQLFNSASSTGTVTATGAATPAIASSAAQGNTDCQSVNNPTTFVITAVAGDSGTYSITLYKRVLA